MPGSPPIVGSIFKKIDAASIFLADVTFVATRLGGPPPPNPNVLIEYGWALRSLSDQRILAVMNTAYGAPDGEALPFDMRHVRRPIQFDLPKDASDETKRAAREGLVRTPVAAARDILAIERPASAPKLFEPQPYGFPRGRCWALGAPLAHADGLMTLAPPIHAPPGPAAWLRLRPMFDPDRIWSIHDLQTAAHHSGELFAPYGLGHVDVGLGWIRDEDGVGVRIVSPHLADARPSRLSFSALVRSGGWTPFRSATEKVSCVPSEERCLTEALSSYRSLLSRLAVVGPYLWEVG